MTSLSLSVQRQDHASRSRRRPAALTAAAIGLAFSSRRHSALATALAVALLSPVAHAGVVHPGMTSWVGEGDAEDYWLVAAGGTLNVTENGKTFEIDLDEGAALNLTGATVRNINNSGQSTAIVVTKATASIKGSEVTSIRGEALLLSGNPGNGAYAVVQDSQLTGIGKAVRMGAGNTLQLSNSKVIGQGNPDATGIRTYGGVVGVTAGSTVTGEGSGIEIFQYSTSDSSQVTIDASTVAANAGSAIVVRSYESNGVQANITLRNGSKVATGNGILLDVQDALVSGGLPTLANLLVESSTLDGNIQVGDASFAHVTLQNGGRINGAFDNVTSATLGNGGYWQLTGDSDVGTLALNAGGTVALGDGSKFNTLTVTGDYTGAGGTVLFNTVLADDASASDKLIINGATSGQTNVAVNNIGGAGAQTVDGIQLIRVDGASNGQFDLTGRAVAGQYEYFLFKGGKADPNDGDWYLRSQLENPTNPGDPCIADPTLPECQPVLRPEPGAYLANQTAAVQMFGQRHHDRSGTADDRGAWARVTRTQAEYGVIGNQLSVDGDTNTLQVGTDVWAWGEGKGQVGVMAGHGSANNTVTSDLTGYSAKGKVTGNMVGVYASWSQQRHEDSGLYLDGSLQHARFDNSVQGDALAKERYDSRASTVSAEAGYGFKVFDSGRSALFVEPQLQVSYRRFDADNLTETNGTLIDGSDADGLSSRVGVRVFGHAELDSGNRVQPFVAVNWIRESSDNSLRFDGEQLAGGLPKNRYEAKAGAELKFGERWSAWGDFGLQRGDGGYKEVAAQIGLRAGW